jgi:dTDP-4-dehydrorhamnose 3,5-epimerase
LFIFCKFLYFILNYNKKLFQDAGLTQDFIQDDISTSYRNVLRGIHGDSKTWKLVSCLKGSFYLVVVNNDSSSLQFGKWEGFTLSDVNRKQVLIPPKFGNGHLVLSESAIFHYKQTTDYDRKGQFTLLWNDPEFDIWWPTDNPILSRRDSGL